MAAISTANRRRRERQSVGRPVDVAHTPVSRSGAAPRLAIIIVVTFLTYLNSLSGPFVFDDLSTVVDNERIRELWVPSSVLFPEQERPVAGRPVANVSFAVNYAVGGTNVRGYHLVNISLHALCALLLFAVVRRTLWLPGMPRQLADRSNDLALAVALVWAVHPLNSEVVDYVTQRTESLMACCYLLTLYASLRAATAASPGAWVALAVTACAIGMGSKESMVTAPLLIVVFDRVFVFGSFRKAFAIRWRLYTGLAATWIVLAWGLASNPRPHSAGFAAGVSPWTYLLNQPPLLLRYLRLTFWPSGMVLNYGWPKAVALGDVLPSTIAVVSLAAVTLAALRRSPKLGFLGIWFFVTLSPTSSIVPIATEVGAERRMYLPLMAILVLLVVGVVMLWNRAKDSFPPAIRASRIVRFAGMGALAAVCMALAAATVTRNREYGSERRLAETILERYPTPIAHQLVAMELLKADERTEAMAHLRAALPGAPRAHLALGVELFRDGRMDEAVAELQAYIREQPFLADVAEAHEYIGRAFATAQRWPEAVAEFRQALAIAPSNAEIRLLLAEALSSQHDTSGAIAQYRAYLDAVQWRDTDAINQLGIALGSTGNLDEAVAVFRRGAEVNPRDGPVQRNLANALWAQRKPDEAIVHARQAAALQPDDADTHDVLGRILEQQGQLAAAAVEYQRALQLDPSFADARSDFERVRRRTEVSR